jgi:hypothetical protein
VRRPITTRSCERCLTPARAGQGNLDNVQAVISDCTEALRLDKTYLKALNRRANAQEKLGTEDSLFEALCGASPR